MSLFYSSTYIETWAEKKMKKNSVIHTEQSPPPRHQKKEKRLAII